MAGHPQGEYVKMRVQGFRVQGFRVPNLNPEPLEP
jgi:hypothetical protein